MNQRLVLEASIVKDVVADKGNLQDFDPKLQVYLSGNNIYLHGKILYYLYSHTVFETNMLEKRIACNNHLKSCLATMPTFENLKPQEINFFLYIHKRNFMQVFGK